MSITLRNGHSRRAKPVAHPVTGKTVAAIYLYRKANREYYAVYNHHKRNRQGRATRETFPHTLEGFNSAIHRRDELDVPKLISTPKPAEEIHAELIRKLEDAGIDGESHLYDNPTFLDEAITQGIASPVKVDVNPQFIALHPDHRKYEAYAEYWGRGGGRFMVDYYERVASGQPEPPKAEDTDNPNGERLPVEQIGEICRMWYVNRKCDHDQAVQEAETYNAEIDQHNANIDQLIEQGKTPNKGKKYRRKQRKDWLHFAPENVRRHYREHQRNYEHFVKWLKENHPKDHFIDRLKGDHFRAYRDHVRKLSRKAKTKSGKAITAPETWCNHRFEVVSSAFNRAHKEYPSAAWAKHLFGDGGYLQILEKTGTVKYGRKYILGRDEFQAFLEAADTQWKAILYLMLNCGVKNSDVSEIKWEDLNLNRGAMIFARTKTGRMRKHPLAKQTLQALKAWKSERDKIDEQRKAEGKEILPNVFVTWQYTKWVTSTDSVYKHFTDILRPKAAEIYGSKIPATPINLRQTRSTLAFRATKSKVVAQMYLGDKDNDSWEHYNEFEPEDLEQAVAYIAEKMF